MKNVTSILNRIAWFAWKLVLAVVLSLSTAIGICIALIVLALTWRPDLPLRMARWWAPALLRLCGVRLEVEGLENVRWERPHVLMMNHQSYIDVPVVFSAVPAPVRFIVKRSLLRIPFLGWYIRATGMIDLDTSKLVQSVRQMERAASVARTDGTVVIFPEGARSRNGSLRRFRRAPFLVPVHAGVPVVPAAILGAGAVHPPGRFVLRPGTIRLRFGRPIETREIDAEMLGQRVEEAVRELFEERVPTPEQAGTDAESAGLIEQVVLPEER